MHPHRQRGPQSFLCDLTASQMVVSDPDCPNAAAHTPHPAAYIAHALWADEMMEAGYEQVECPGCGRFAIWTGPQPTRVVDPGSVSWI